MPLWKNVFFRGFFTGKQIKGAHRIAMKIMVLSSFTTSLFWFRIDMMKSFLAAGCEVVAVGDGPEGEWEPKFRELGIRYRQIPVQRNGMNPLHDLKTLWAIFRLLGQELLSVAAGFAVCILMLLYFVCHLALSRKY